MAQGKTLLLLITEMKNQTINEKTVHTHNFFNRKGHILTKM
jgi:hypothetical protein